MPLQADGLPAAAVSVNATRTLTETSKTEGITVMAGSVDDQAAQINTKGATDSMHANELKEQISELESLLEPIESVIRSAEPGVHKEATKAVAEDHKSNKDPEDHGPVSCLCVFLQTCLHMCTHMPINMSMKHGNAQSKASPEGMKMDREAPVRDSCVPGMMHAYRVHNC